MRTAVACLSVPFLASLFACSGVSTPPVEQAEAPQRQAPVVPAQEPQAVTPKPEKPSEPAGPTIYQEKEEFKVGQISYRVESCQWKNRLSNNQFLDSRPDAAYLFVMLSVYNGDKKARNIPPVVMVDERGAEYQPSPKSWAVEDSIGVLDSINPGVTRSGFVIFDAPPGRSYRLKVSGGFLSFADALVQLDPTSPEREKQKAEAAIAAQKKADEEVRLAEMKRKAEEAAEKQRLQDAAKWRNWTTPDGEIHAKFATAVSGEVTLEKQDGQTAKWPLGSLSAEDQNFIRNREWLKAVK